MARYLAAEGAKLALLARDPDELARAQTELRSGGAEVITIVGDVREPATADRAVQTTVTEFGALDALINNAGIIMVGPLENMTQNDFDDAFATHVWGPQRFMNAALPHLKKSLGRIVNISSIGGKIAIPHLAAYSASKFALAGLSDAYRNELAKDGVKVTSVFPGLMRSGSHVHATFKGNHSAEFGWFALGSATPLTSISVERAARHILEACRAGAPQILVGWQAKIAVLAHTLFPNIAGANAASIAHVMPAATADSETLPGSEARGAFPPRFVTSLPDAASLRNNETGS